MFGSLGFGEVMMILIIGLIIFGPKKLPEIGRSLGNAIREFRRASNDIVNALSLDTTDYTTPSRRNYSDYSNHSSSYDSAGYLDQTIAQSDLPADDINVAPSPEEPFQTPTEDTISKAASHPVRHRSRTRRPVTSTRTATAHRNNRRRV